MESEKLNRIKEVLREQGRTNKWLSGQIDRNEVTISRWCRNTQQPDLDFVGEGACFTRGIKLPGFSRHCVYVSLGTGLFLFHLKKKRK